MQVRPQLQASSSPPSLAHIRLGSTHASLSANAAQLMYAATGQSYQYLTQETAAIGLQVIYLIIMLVWNFCLLLFNQYYRYVFLIY